MFMSPLSQFGRHRRRREGKKKKKKRVGPAKKTGTIFTVPRPR